jgi:hypothetical protein
MTAAGAFFMWWAASVGWKHHCAENESKVTTLDAAMLMSLIRPPHTTTASWRTPVGIANLLAIRAVFAIFD